MKNLIIILLLSATGIQNIQAQLTPLEIASKAEYFKNGFGIEASKILLGTFDFSVEQKLTRNFALVLNTGYKVPLSNFEQNNVRNARQYSRGGAFVALHPRLVAYRSNDPNSELFYVGLGYGISFSGVEDNVSIKTYYDEYKTKVINRFTAQAASFRFGFIFGHTGPLRYELGFGLNRIMLNKKIDTDSENAIISNFDVLPVPGYGSCVSLNNEGNPYLSGQLTFKVKYMVNFQKK